MMYFILAFCDQVNIIYAKITQKLYHLFFLFTYKHQAIAKG